MEYREFTGKTVEEAIENGLKELGITAENADIRVLEEGKKKLFSSVKARVEIAVKEKVEESVPVASEVLSDGERTVAFLEGLFKILGITAVTELVSEDEKVEINVVSTGSKSVIGKRGETLDAIQTLAGAVANTGREKYKRVVVDCENYRENREVTLNKLAGNLAEKATRLGKKIKLEPMNPYERRIIHSALSSYEGVKTESEGKEPNRYIVVIPDNVEDPDAEPILARNERRNDRNGRRNDKGRGGYGNKNRAFGNKRSGGYKKPQGGSSAQTGGTSLKGNDFFGIFLGNSNKDE
jgi:spoIIIJ-associated protein